jgi:transcriptional regulator with XRE-family HTH domain
MPREEARVRRATESSSIQTIIRPKGGRSGALLWANREPPKMPRRSIAAPFALQVGTRIRELRLEKGWSLATLADQSALSKGHLSSVEHGLAAITIQTIERLAEGFGISPMYILTFAEDDERAHTAELLRNLSTKDVRKFRKQIQAEVAARG